eukprot:TRINITY_DN538_c0_g1_i14.p2 TRINITY_DN538_c0_g1~~TRINITY_DN538_c0_g1_i14.p2  ORF type:complete len:153 (-),score=47.04 TRINITY_DN538_c0_g1_i14:270-728(-)
MHVQNMILYFWGSIANLIIAFSQDSDLGFFEGMDNVPVMFVLLSQSFLGIAITAALKYGGAMVKTIAASVQSCVLLVFDWTIFGVVFNLQSFGGVVTVLCTSFMYLNIANHMPTDDMQQGCPEAAYTGMRWSCGVVMGVASVLSLVYVVFFV